MVIKICEEVIAEEPDYMDPRIMAIKINVTGSDCESLMHMRLQIAMFQRARKTYFTEH